MFYTTAPLNYFQFDFEKTKQRLGYQAEQRFCRYALHRAREMFQY